MARWTWTNIATTQSSQVPWEGALLPGGQVLADCNLDGAFIGTFFVVLVEDTDGTLRSSAELRQNRPTLAPAGGTRVQWRNVTQTTSDTTPYPPDIAPAEQTQLPGCTITATVRVANTNVGTVKLVVVKQPEGTVAFSWSGVV